MNVRNPKYNQAGSIDCEVNHAEYGWIPFTAVTGDPNSDVVLAEIDSAGLVIAPKPPKTQLELEKEASEQAKIALAKLRSETFPELLVFIAALPGAPKVLKDAAATAAAEKIKIKP